MCVVCVAGVGRWGGGLLRQIACSRSSSDGRQQGGGTNWPHARQAGGPRGLGLGRRCQSWRLCLPACTSACLPAWPPKHSLRRRAHTQPRHLPPWLASTAAGRGVDPGAPTCSASVSRRWSMAGMEDREGSQPSVSVSHWMRRCSSLATKLIASISLFSCGTCRPPQCAMRRAPPTWRAGGAAVGSCQNWGAHASA